MGVNENIVETNGLDKKSLEKTESVLCLVLDSPRPPNALQALPAWAAVKCRRWQAA